MSTAAIEPEFELAAYGRRAVAHVIDTFIALVIAGTALAVVAQTVQGAKPGLVMLAMIGGFATFPAYFVIGHGGRRGQTIGKRMMRVSVRDHEGERIGYGRAFGRVLTMLVVNFVPVLSLFALFRPLWDRHNRAFHDDIAKTFVYRVR